MLAKTGVKKDILARAVEGHISSDIMNLVDTLGHFFCGPQE